MLAAGSGASAALGNATTQLGVMYAGRQEEFDRLYRTYGKVSWRDCFSRVVGAL